MQTKNVDARVRHCAITLVDERLIAKLSAGDMMAIEAKYHARCLAGLYNRMRDFETADSAGSTAAPDDMPLSEFYARTHAVAFAQLIAYIEEVKLDSVTLPIFKLSKLADM